MSSQPASREDGRRLSLRTLAIASAASGTAAVVTSLFWKGGTPIAAAVTPVMVAVISELLHRPANVIVNRFTAETDALPVEAASAGAPPPRATSRRQGPAPDLPSAPEMSVYRSAPRRPRLAFKPIAATAALAFVIAAAALTLPELIAGQSVGKGDRETTLFGGAGRGDSSSDDDAAPDTPPADAPDQPTVPEPQPESQPPQAPQETTPADPEPPRAEPPPAPAPAPRPPAPAPGEPAP